MTFRRIVLRDGVLVRRIARLALVVGASLLPSVALAQPATQRSSDQEARLPGIGAAMCVTAGEILAARPRADVRTPPTLRAWRHILHVIDTSPEARQAVLDSARASWESLRSRPDSLRRRGVDPVIDGAEYYWYRGCDPRRVQLWYLSEYGGAERIETHLAEEPGTELGAEAAARLKRSTVCLVSAEVLLRPKRRLQDAIGAATPPVPLPDALSEIRNRSRRELESGSGSQEGKELLVEYTKLLFDVASETLEPQAFVDRTTRGLLPCHFPA